MSRSLHQKFNEGELSLTDYLALDRTILANERTALAYGRTVLAMLIIGGTCISYFDHWAMWTIGGVFIAGGIITGILGLHRYRQTQRFLEAALDRETGKTEHPLQEDVEAKRAEEGE